MSLSYNAVICNYQRQRHHSKSGGRGSVKKNLYVELINKCKLKLQLLESSHNATFLHYTDYHPPTYIIAFFAKWEGGHAPPI